VRDGGEGGFREGLLEEHGEPRTGFRRELYPVLMDGTLGLSLIIPFPNSHLNQIMEFAPSPRTELLSSDEILIRLVEVSAMLHEERGNREELQRERTELVEEARRRSLLRPGAPVTAR